jgi:putative ABC transport system permease protein
MLRTWRAAARSVLRRPGLAATIVATLALAIGANSVIFSAVDAVLLRPRPFPAADRLVRVFERNLSLRQATQLVAPGRLEEWNDRNETFEGLAASYFENMTDTSGPLPERVEAIRTSPRFFAVLGVPPAIGRWPAPQEERFGGPAVIVVSDAFWRRRLAADPAIIGRPLSIGGARRTVVAVMPPSFRYPTASTDIWVPTQAPPFFLEARRARLYAAVGRLKPGVTIEQGQDDLSGVQARLGETFPETDRGWGAALVPLKDSEVGGIRRSLWLLMGAVALVLLAACGNIACLLLADAARRRHEIAVRLALGAERRRVVGQLLREGLVLAAGGSAAGLMLADAGIAAVRRAGDDLPRLAGVHADVRLIAFTLGLGTATSIVFAVGPALVAARQDPAEALARGGRSQVGGRHLVQRVLVAAQVALAIVLLAGAGLLLRSFVRIQSIRPGFDPDGVLTFRMSAQWSERADAVVQRQARTIARLEAVRGVEAAAFSQLLPGGIDVPPIEFRIAGRDPREKTFALGRSVSAGYFRVLRIPLLQGATCSADPAAIPYATVLVTRAFADRFFPGEDPIGHAILVPSQLTDARIVGIVGDVREGGIVKDAEPLIYWCGNNPYWPDPFFLVRLDRAHPASMTEIRAALRDIEPQRAVYAARPLAELVASFLIERRLMTALLAGFSISAAALAMLGLYGILTQFVATRRREIGVRIALGAASHRIVASVVGEAGLVTGAGIVVGLTTALGLAQLLQTMVVGVAVRDPITFVGVPALLSAVAAVASYLPARRAAAIDPMRALREF